jgi:hypothetical protein
MGRCLKFAANSLSKVNAAVITGPYNVSRFTGIFASFSGGVFDRNGFSQSDRRSLSRRNSQRNEMGCYVPDVQFPDRSFILQLYH